MIKITYSDGSYKEYNSLIDARIMTLNKLFASNGKIIPVSAVEVMAKTLNGSTIERDLQIRLGVIDFNI